MASIWLLLKQPLPFSNYSAFQGLYALTLAVCLVSASAQPIIPPFIPGLAAGLTTSVVGGSLVTAGAAGAVVNTVPLASAALGGGILAGVGVGKALLIKAILDARE